MRIIVTGSIAYDYVMVFPGQFQDHILPDKMHVLSVSFLVDSMKKPPRRDGGRIIAYNLALARREVPNWSATVGQDFADLSRAWLERPGGQRLEGIKVDRRRLHLVLLHQHRPEAQPDHRLLPRRHDQGTPTSIRSGQLRPSPPSDLVLIAPNAPDAMAKAYTRRMHRAGHPLPVRPLDAGAADDRRRAGSRLREGRRS